MIDATLSPATRMQLIVQKLRDANVLRSSIPSAQPQFIGGNYVPPIADMVKGVFNRLDANTSENEAMDAFKLLDSQQRSAREDFAKKYSDVSADDRNTLLKAAIEATTNPLLEGSEEGKLFTTLLKPQSSLFGTPVIAEGRQVTRGANPTTTEIPGVTPLVDAERKARMDNIAEDNAFKRQQADYAKSEDERKAQLHEVEYKEHQERLNQEREDRLKKEEDARFEKFDAATKDLLPVYEAARQAQGILQQYPDEIPGYSPLGNAKAKLGGLGMDAEEKRVRATFDKLQELFQNYVTGAAAPDEQARRIAGIIGRQPLDSPDIIRKVLPDLLQYLDAINTSKRAILGEPDVSSAILGNRASSFARYLLPHEEAPVVVDPAMDPASKAALEGSDELRRQQDAIAKKLGVDPNKVRAVVKVK